MLQVLAADQCFKFPQMFLPNLRVMLTLACAGRWTCRGIALYCKENFDELLTEFPHHSCAP